MPIVEMKKISLLGHRQERDQIVDLLHRMGTVEIVDLQESDAWPELAPLLELDQASEAAASIESRLGEVRYCLDFFHRYFPVRKSFVEQFIGSKLEISSDEFTRLVGRAEEIFAVYTACREAEERLTKIRNEETRCRNMLEDLAPWAGFLLPLGEIYCSLRVEMGLATVPEDAYPALKEALAVQAPDFNLEEVSVDKELAHIFYIFPAGDYDLVQPLFKEASVALVSFPEVTGTAAETACALEKKFTELSAERDAVLAGVEELLVHRPQLMALYDYLDNERAKREAAANMARTQSSFVMEGWVPAPALEKLEQSLHAETATAVLVSRDPDKHEEVPVLLQNKGPAEACEVVTRLYSVPRREELDPTPFMAPFFLIFFGICMADVGYGVALSLLALFLSYKLKLAGMGKQLVNLLLWGGVSSVIFGVLQGGYFADLFRLPPLWFNPLDGDGLVKMLLICFGLGLFHMYFGMAIQAYRSIKAGKPLDALFDQGSWFITLNGLIMFVLPGMGEAARWVVIAGVLSLLLTQGRRQKGLLRKFAGGLGSLYNIMNYLSGVLSYSRLLALGLSTAVIGSVFNLISKLVEVPFLGLVFMLLVLVGGHLFNLLIGVLGAYVHASRLQYIEFFGQFYEGGGKAFKPFAMKTKFVDVVETEPSLLKAGMEAAAPSA